MLKDVPDAKKYDFSEVILKTGMPPGKTFIDVFTVEHEQSAVVPVVTKSIVGACKLPSNSNLESQGERPGRHLVLGCRLILCAGQEIAPFQLHFTSEIGHGHSDG